MTIKTKRVKVWRGGDIEYLPGLGEDVEVTSFNAITVERWKRVEFRIGRLVVPLTRWKRISR